jgi:hypothetical protein
MSRVVSIPASYPADTEFESPFGYWIFALNLIFLFLFVVINDGNSIYQQTMYL